MSPPDSLWWSALEPTSTRRPPLASHVDVDVAIVGGGFTGLWTARELLRRDPTMRVAVLEREICGFGASGRNGGWASALYPQSLAALERRRPGDGARVGAVLRQAVGDLGVALSADGIDAHYHQGGTLTFARNPFQEERLRAEVDEARGWGAGPDDVVWLGPDEASARARVAGARGALYTRHCARVQPALLVRGLAAVVESLGAHIYEGTAVTRILARSGRNPATVVTVAGTVHAEVVVRATEGYSASLPGLRRDLAPIYSLMIATEPLAPAFWEEVGFEDRETFNDGRNLLIYGQRTADDRIAFGGRGAPYHFGSVIEPRFDHVDKVFRLLEAALSELLPSFAGAITHRWGGPLGMPRDLSPRVAYDRRTGLALAGGYTGDGVVLSRVAAQALADAITAPDQSTEFTDLPFVDLPRRRWEPEPWRWLGINTGLAAATWADRQERRGRSSRAGAVVDRLMS